MSKRIIGRLRRYSAGGDGSQDSGAVASASDVAHEDSSAAPGDPHDGSLAAPMAGDLDVTEGEAGNPEDGAAASAEASNDELVAKAMAEVLGADFTAGEEGSSDSESEVIEGDAAEGNPEDMVAALFAKTREDLEREAQEAALKEASTVAAGASASSARAHDAADDGIEEMSLPSSPPVGRHPSSPDRRLAWGEEQPSADGVGVSDHKIIVGDVSKGKGLDK